jgi:positive regulator of sigma E activity
MTKIFCFGFLAILCVILALGCAQQSFCGSVKTNTVNGTIATIQVTFPSNATLSTGEEIDNAIAQTEMIASALKAAKQQFKRNDDK